MSLLLGAETEAYLLGCHSENFYHQPEELLAIFLEGVGNDVSLLGPQGTLVSRILGATVMSGGNERNSGKEPMYPRLNPLPRREW